MNYQSDLRFQKLVGFVLNSEGGYVNHPADPGGPTKCGIALNYNTTICKEFGIFSAETMRTLMTPDIAKQIYYRKYWTSVGCERIASDRLAYIHFDNAVNCGVGSAAAALLNIGMNVTAYEAEGKNVDFWWKLFVRYEAARLRYYTRCRNRKPFMDGWVNRVCDIVDRACTLPD